MPRDARWAARPIAAACWCVFDEDERDSNGGRFLKKDGDGYCTHLDRDNHRCGNWDKRPRACRGYDCNGDFLLQVAVRNEFSNIVELVKLAASFYIAREFYVHVPPVGEE